MMKPRHLPTFIEGIDLRELHPTKEGKRVRRFVSIGKQYLIFARKDFPRDVRSARFYDATGRLWLTVEVNEYSVIFRVEAEYSWNGASPKRWYPLVGWVGTPDWFNLETFWHDVLCQFEKCKDMPLKRSQMDKLFQTMIEMRGSPLRAKVFYGAIRSLGWMFTERDRKEYSEPI